MKRLYILSVVTLGLAAMTSCDDYMDVNTDPNSPSADVVTTSMIMPAVEMNLAASYGDFMRITGGYFAQHYAQEFGTSNYVDYSSFYISATRSSSTYTQLFQRVLSNAQAIIEKAESENDYGTLLAATTIRAFTYEALVDCYGEVPYTEALRGITSPAYDDGETIYRGILAELDAALEKTSTGDVVCSNFLYPGEKADKWIKFANSLKLRILTRSVDKLSDLQSSLDKLVADGNFIDSDVQWAGCWGNESGQESPFFAEEFATNFGSTQINVVPNIAILGTMIQDSYVDPRITAFWTTGSNGKYNGYISSNVQILQGTVDAAGNTCDASYFSRPVASYDMPVVILSLSDVEFYLTEYYAKKNQATDAADHYSAAVNASFDACGVAGADANISQFPYDQNNWKKVIGIAKWVANAGFNGFEAWCEMRRLDYPTFENPSVTGADFDNGSVLDPSSYSPGTIYTPKNVRSEIGANSLIERWPYAESSTARNSNAPAFPGHTKPVFWAE